MAIGQGLSEWRGGRSLVLENKTATGSISRALHAAWRHAKHYAVLAGLYIGWVLVSSFAGIGPPIQPTDGANSVNVNLISGMYQAPLALQAVGVFVAVSFGVAFISAYHDELESEAVPEEMAGAAVAKPGDWGIDWQRPKAMAAWPIAWREPAPSLLRPTGVFSLLKPLDSPH